MCVRACVRLCVCGSGVSSLSDRIYRNVSPTGAQVTRRTPEDLRGGSLRAWEQAHKLGCWLALRSYCGSQAGKEQSQGGGLSQCRSLAWWRPQWPNHLCYCYVNPRPGKRHSGGMSNLQGRAMDTFSFSSHVERGQGMETHRYPAVDAAHSIRTQVLTVLSSCGAPAVTPPWSHPLPDKNHFQLPVLASFSQGPCEFHL